MSETIYKRLFRAPPPDIKSWTEDFLTEALGDLLSHMPTVQQISFVEGLLLKNISDSEWKLQFIEGLAGKILYWETQHIISGSVLPNKGRVPGFYGKRPDVVLFADGRPVLVIEAKVDAPATEDQVERYGQWLRCEQLMPVTMTAVVLLLTKISRAPRLFKVGGDTCCSNDQRMSVITWNDLYEWLSESSRVEDQGLNNCRSLSTEFRNFLLEVEVAESQVTNSPANSEHIQATQNFFSVRGHLASVINSVGDEICKQLAKAHIYGSPKAILLDERRNTYWSYLPNTNGAYVGWGFYFPSQGDTWSNCRSCEVGSSYLFLCIESDQNLSSRFRRISRLPEGWNIVKDETLIRLHLLTPQVSDEGDFSQVAVNWAATDMSEVWNTFEDLNRP